MCLAVAVLFVRFLGSAAVGVAVPLVHLVDT